MKNFFSTKLQIVFRALKCLLLLIFFNSISIKSISQWEWLNPKPAGYNNTKVVFINEATGFILNTNGDLEKTTDTGRTWTFSHNFSNAICMDIKGSAGVIAGWFGTLYISSDSGSTWHQITTGINTAFTNISIINRDTFFLSSNYQHSNSNYIYKTFDAGKTFATINCGISIFSMFFTNSQTGFVGGYFGTIMKTEDGGTSWKQKHVVSSYPSGIIEMQFLGNDTGYAFQQTDSLLITYDGGDTWKSSFINASLDGTGTMFFQNSQDGYIAGSNGSMYATHDGGKTFITATHDYLYSGYDINSIYFLSKDAGFTVGNFGRISKTIDDCQTWSHYATSYNLIEGVSFASDSTGYAISGLTIFKTTDKAQTWNQLAFHLGNNFNMKAFKQVYFYNPDTGIIISSNPVWIHHTYNGGATWDTINPLYPNGADDIYDMQFIDAKTGFINLYSTGNSWIMKTTDGGRKWKTVYNGTYFKKIFYVNADTGYASRGNMLYKTTDKSKTWNLVFTDSYFANINGIAFSNSLKGIISTDGGGILSTNDGGITWTGSDFYISSNINTMKFYDAATGYLCAGNLFMPASYGYIYKTTDSGATWQLNENVGGAFITFTPDAKVLVTGNGGEILRADVNEVVLADHNIKLNGDYTSNGVMLSWQIENEFGNDNFTVLRSENGSDFKSISNNKSTLNKNTYQFNDATVMSTMTNKVFYKILSIDKNNKATYSNTITINIPQRNIHLNIIPNPATSTALINLGISIFAKSITVFDVSGKKIYSADLKNQQLNNYTLNVSHFVPGVYFVEIVSDTTRYITKLSVGK